MISDAALSRLQQGQRVKPSERLEKEMQERRKRKMFVSKHKTNAAKRAKNKILALRATQWAGQVGMKSKPVHLNGEDSEYALNKGKDGEKHITDWVEDEFVNLLLDEEEN